MKRAIILFTSMCTLVSCGEDTPVDEKPTVDTPIVQIDTPRTLTMQEKMSGFPPHCAEQGNCADGSCQEEIVKIHALEYIDYWNSIVAFHSDQGIGEDGIPDPYTQTRAQIEQLVSVACSSYRIKFVLGTDYSTHSGVRLVRTAGWAPAQGETNSYSIAFFKGLLNRGADSFAFYRAKSEMGNNTLAIAAFDEQHTNVFYGDLSDTHPGLPSDTSRKPNDSIRR